MKRPSQGRTSKAADLQAPRIANMVNFTDSDVAVNGGNSLKQRESIQENLRTSPTGASVSWIDSVRVRRYPFPLFVTGASPRERAHLSACEERLYPHRYANGIVGMSAISML